GGRGAPDPDRDAVIRPPRRRRSRSGAIPRNAEEPRRGSGAVGVSEEPEARPAARVAEPTARPGARLAELESRRAALMDELEGRRASLPLRYWRQQAHLTTPASDLDLARKALEGGTAPMGRLLDRHGIAPTDLADALGVDVRLVEGLLERPRGAPLVVLDGEDAQAPGAEAAEAGLRNTVTLLSRTDRTGDLQPLRFFRPPGLEAPTAIATIGALLRRLAEGAAGGPLPLDGIVLPKVRHPEEIDLVEEVLEALESELGLPLESVKLAILVESGWAVARLPEIARRAVPRLCALVYGPVDHAADVGLPAIAAHHPV